MDKHDKREKTVKKSDEQPVRIRVPGFISGDEVGLGDVIKGMTSRVGIRPCGGCRSRAEILNNWVVFKR